MKTWDLKTNLRSSKVLGVFRNHRDNWKRVFCYCFTFICKQLLSCFSLWCLTMHLGNCLHVCLFKNQWALVCRLSSIKLLKGWLRGKTWTKDFVLNYLAHYPWKYVCLQLTACPSQEWALLSHMAGRGSWSTGSVTVAKNLPAPSACSSLLNVLCFASWSLHGFWGYRWRERGQVDQPCLLVHQELSQNSLSKIVPLGFIAYTGSHGHPSYTGDGKEKQA